MKIKRNTTTKREPAHQNAVNDFVPNNFFRRRLFLSTKINAYISSSDLPLLMVWPEKLLEIHNTSFLMNLSNSLSVHFT